MKKVLKNKVLWIIVLISTLVILVAVYYGGEYRFSSFKLLKTGSIEIQLDRANNNIFIDNKRVGFSTEENQTLIFNKIRPGIHTILIARNKSWPWTKKIKVGKGEKIKIHPFVLPIKDLDIFILDKKDKKYSEVKNLIDLSLFSIKKKEVFSTDRTSKILIDGNKIIGEKVNNAEEKFLIFESAKDKIKNITFYKDRNDVIIFASGKFIYVIEIYKKGGQNFQPLLQGTDPVFVNKNFESLYILDNNILFQVNL